MIDNDLSDTHDLLALLDRGSRRLRAEFGSAATVDKYPPDRGVEPVDLEIRLRVDLEGRSAEGSVTHRVVGRRSDARTLRLDAVAFEEVEVEGDDAPLRWSYDGEAIEITWDEPFAVDEERRLTVRYRVDSPSTGILFSKPTAAQPEAPYFAAVDNETERARYWLPCVDHPSVRPTLTFHLSADKRWTILANGLCTGEVDNADGTTTSSWRLEQGCPSYLTCFAIGEFIRVDDESVGDVEVAYFVSPTRDAAALRRSFGRTPAMLRWMAERLQVPFPFPKYYQFAVPGIGGAMENISLVSWDEVFVVDEALATEIGGLVDRINVHEMAHSYFGDSVVIRDFCDAWLKESWAVYIEACWLEHAEGEDAMRYDLWECLQRYIGEAEGRYVRPIATRRFDTSWDLFDAHLYPGGAVRLHMLRREIGDEVFWRATTDYLREYGGGVAETDDFRRCLERRSGRSLAKFFDQWLRSPGYPKLKAKFRHDAAKGEGIVEIEQTQVDSKKGIPCFDLPLDVEWTIDGETQRRTLQVHREKHAFVLPMAADPTSVRLDPDSRIVCALDFNPGSPRLRAQLRDAPDVIGRILAGRELVKSGARGDLRALAEAWPQEPFWGVRLAWAQALAKAGSEQALEILLGALETEEDARVLPTLLQSIGKYRDPAIAPAIAARLDRGDLAHRAKAAAYESLGAQRHRLPEAEKRRLIDAASRPSFASFATAGALRGLASTRAPEAAELLSAAVEPCSPCGDGARPTAAVALGSLARVLDRGPRAAAIEALVDRLRDPSQRVRDAAVTGLRLADARQAAGAIEAYAKPLAAQFRIPHMRAVDSLRRGQPSATIRALERSVGELETKLRELQGTVEKLEDRHASADPTEAETETQADAEATPNGSA